MKVLFLVFALNFGFAYSVNATTVNCSDSESCSKALENLQHQLLLGQKKINVSQSIADRYQQGLQDLNSKMRSTANQMQRTQDQITNVNEQIDATNKNIDDETIRLQQLREQIKEEIVQMYQTSQMPMFEMFLLSRTLSEAAAKMQNLQSLQNATQQKVDEVKQIEQNLSQQKDTLQKQKDSLSKLNSDLDGHKKNLAVQTNQTNFLLNATQAQLDTYLAKQEVIKQQIAAVQQRLANLIREGNWGSDIVSGPAASWMYNQLDYSDTLGDSPYTIHDYGCLITSIAMVATYYGHHITPPQIANHSAYFDGGGYAHVSDIVSNIGLSVFQNGPANWDTIDNELSNGHPVIISIYLPQVGVINSDGSSHYIVLQAKAGNKYLMQDPLGTERSYALKYVRSMYILHSN